MTKRILLAEDDEDDRLIFQEVFSGFPRGIYRLSSVGNGEEVMQMLNGISDPMQLPHLVILDQNMPVMNGRETLIALKQNDLLQQIPVVIYSTYNDKSFIEECETLGVKAVVSKPDSYEGFVDMINSLLQYTR